jgi:hypothetical protein
MQKLTLNGSNKQEVKSMAQSKIGLFKFQKRVCWGAGFSNFWRELMKYSTSKLVIISRAHSATFLNFFFNKRKKER